MAFVLAGVALFPGAANAQTIQVDKNNRTIAVTANDKASALADTAIVTVAGFPRWLFADRVDGVVVRLHETKVGDAGQ